MTTTREQYQHYIPRFILRTFQTDPTRSPARSRRKKKQADGYTRLDTETIHSYNLGTGEYDPNCRIAMAFGTKGLYQDVKNVNDANHIEEKFAKLENDASRVIKSIQKDADRFMMTTSILRKNVYALRKFLFLQHLRAEKISKTYFDEDHPANAGFRDWIRKQKEIHDVPSDTLLCLNGLQYYLETPTRQILQDSESIFADPSLMTMEKIVEGDLDPDLKQWHAITYARFHNEHYLSVCYASKDGEFVLGHNSFGMWEGTVLGSQAHLLYIISPKIAIVLRRNISKLVPRSMVDSILNDIPFNPPATIYSVPQNVTRNSESLIQHIKSTAADYDRFTFTIHELSHIQTYRINEIVLENVHADGTLAFASEKNMLNVLMMYDSPDGSFDKPHRILLRILKEKLLERAHVRGGHSQGASPITPSSANPQAVTERVTTTYTLSKADLPSSPISNPNPTIITPVIGTESSGTSRPVLQSKMVVDAVETFNTQAPNNADFPSCGPPQVAEQSHSIQTMSNEEAEYEYPWQMDWNPSRIRDVSVPENLPHILNAHEYEHPETWEDFIIGNSESEIRNANEDDLPETFADVQFKRVLASIKADTFELHSIKARKLYKAAIAEAHMNNPLALKIRASIANAVNRSIERENNTSLGFRNPIRVENQYLHFHRHSDSWIQLSDKVENILMNHEYEYFFNAVAAKMQKCVTEQDCILTGPGTAPLVNSAAVCGLLEWYVKHDFVTLMSSMEFWLVGREIGRKLLVHIRPSAAGRIAIYQMLQILWCMWKFTSTEKEIHTLLLAFIIPTYGNWGHGDVKVLLAMLSQFSFFTDSVSWLLGICWSLIKYLCLFGILINLIKYMFSTQGRA